MSDEMLRADIWEEDEVRRLLHTPERITLVPYATLRRTRLPARIAWVRLLLAFALTTFGVFLTLQFGGTALRSGTPQRAQTCAQPGSLDLARRQTSPTLRSALGGVVIDGTGNAQWVLRFLSAPEAGGTAFVDARVSIASVAGSLPVLGYALAEPETRSLSVGEQVAIPACQAVTLLVRTPAEGLKGVATYDITIESVTAPEGAHVREQLRVALTCNAQSCDAVRSQ